MFKKSVFIVLVLAMALASGCSRKNNKVQNPLANVGSVQPDKVLFDRALDALQHRKYDVARLTFQTLINTTPGLDINAEALRLQSTLQGIYDEKR